MIAHEKGFQFHINWRIFLLLIVLSNNIEQSLQHSAPDIDYNSKQVFKKVVFGLRQYFDSY